MDERTRQVGRPRSEDARLAVLRAVDDMLVEEGYAAMTMKGIAERAKVGRQTVYRWWSSKAEILLEASAADATRELAVAPGENAQDDVAAFLTALSEFLTRSDAGLAYRALLGEAQHDAKVAALLHGTDVLGDAARALIAQVEDRGALAPTAGGEREVRVAELVGPTLFRTLGGGAAWAPAEVAVLARRFLLG